jgi:hypothetical protein
MSGYVAVLVDSHTAISAAANVANAAEPSWGLIPRGTDRRENPCNRVKARDRALLEH